MSRNIVEFEGLQCGMDLTEAEYIKKRWQEYTELCKKDFHNQNNHDGVVTRRKLNLLESEAKWPQEASLQTKLVEVLELQLSYFQT